ncbi:MAG TPA: hypothetical protein VMV56_07640 [Williamwhitmania sp.]|nr:hypothetical protein [Williamwhitmania sp.]
MKKFLLFSIAFLLLAGSLFAGATNYDRLVLGSTNYHTDPHPTADIVGRYDGYFSNETDNAWKLSENDENLIFTFGTNSVTLSSDSGVTAFSFGSLIPTWAYGYFVSDGDSVNINPYKNLYLIRAAVGGAKMFTVDSTGIGYFAGDLSVIGGDITGANGNAIDIGEAVDGTILFSRDDAGTVTLTSADNDANAALTIVAGGTGALTLGDNGSTTAITSSDWGISDTGVMTGIGNITMNGTFTDGTYSSTAGAFTGVASISDGTARWSSNKLIGFTSLTADTVTNGTWSCIGGTMSGIADLGAVTTADINAGTFDGTVGGTTPAAGTFTTLGDGTWSTTAGVFSGIADLGAVTTADINAGTFDGIVGGTTPADGSFTTLSTTGNVSITSADLAVAANNAMIITATTSITTGSNYAVEINHTNTAGSTANLAGLFATTTAGANGSGFMGIMSRVDMDAYQASTGGANALYGEILLPDAAQNGGEYHVAVLTLAESGAGFVPINNVTIPTSFMKYETWGDGAEHIDDYAYLFYLNGFTAEADHLVSLTKQTARVNIGKVARYMVLSQMQDGLGLGVSGTPMVLAATTDQATEIFSAGSSTSGNHFHNYIKATSTAQSTGGDFGLYVENDVAYQAAGHNAGYFKVDMNAIQAPTGGASVVNAELVMPTGVQNGGQYNAFVADIECPATMDMFYNAAIPSGFMKLEVYGNSTAVTDFNLSANLFNLSGITAATDAMLESTIVADANVSITHSLRINIGGTPYYIALNTAKTW